MTAQHWRLLALSLFLGSVPLTMAGLWAEWLLWAGAAANCAGVVASEVWRWRLEASP